jgi:hypothetical protein
MTTMERPLSGVKADVFSIYEGKVSFDRGRIRRIVLPPASVCSKFPIFSQGPLPDSRALHFHPPMIDRRHDYYVFTSRRGDYPERWSWEIRRKSKPLGVKLTADGFQSDVAAQFAGKRALEDFLCELSKEEKHQRK